MKVHTVALRCGANDHFKLGVSQRMDRNILAPLSDARLITETRNIAKMEHSLGILVDVNFCVYLANQ